jgi:hypothetical protein
VTYDHSMDRPSDGSALALEPVLAGTVVAQGLFRLNPADSKAMRRRPGPIPERWERVPPTLLRYSDEQTVAGVAAVFTALDEGGLEPEAFAGWGVVAASRFLGRANLAQALDNFSTEGVWGTSPHLIPHFALHSLSGSISLALGLHGPNLGVGGGLHATAEGFLTALTWLEAGIVPGVWLVLTGWVPELIPEAKNCAPPSGTECHALALALVPAGMPGDGPHRLVRIITRETPRQVLAAPDLSRLAQKLQSRDAIEPRTIATDPSGRLQVELVTAGDGAVAFVEDKEITG